MVFVVGVLEVVAGRPEGLEHHRRAVGGQQAPEREHMIVHPAPRQPALLPDVRVFGSADPPVRLGEPFQLAGRHRRRHVRQVPLGLRRRDPSQRPDLGI
jgi:hypothetical protein